MKRALFLAVFVLLAMSASADTILVADYIAELERIDALLGANELQPAKDAAGALGKHVVSAPGGTFLPDANLLNAVAGVSRADVQLRARIRTTVNELRHVSAEDSGVVDPKLLRQVATEQEVPDLVPGGEVTVKPQSSSLIERVFRSFSDIIEWIGKRVERFLDWLLDFFPTTRRGESGATGGMRWIVTALVVVIVLLIILLAIEVTRRARRAAPEVVESGEEIGSKRDEDPLSRGATEWERYAAQLAAAGRYREAIRAWYHAVLVTCYSAGILHFRKSRTNWEYIATLAPSIVWRPELIELTRRFEREWYGADQSTREALDECSRRARAIIENIHAVSRGAA